MKTTKCENCEFYFPSDEDYGKCRVSPPTIVLPIAMHAAKADWVVGEGVWPRVKRFDWCGSYSSTFRAKQDSPPGDELDKLEQIKREGPSHLWPAG